MSFFGDCHRALKHHTHYINENCQICWWTIRLSEFKWLYPDDRLMGNRSGCGATSWSGYKRRVRFVLAAKRLMKLLTVVPDVDSRQRCCNGGGDIGSGQQCGRPTGHSPVPCSDLGITGRSYHLIRWHRGIFDFKKFVFNMWKQNDLWHIEPIISKRA